VRRTTEQSSEKENNRAEQREGEQQSRAVRRRTTEQRSEKENRAEQ
jgi:hypothetical protein